MNQPAGASAAQPAPSEQPVYNMEHGGVVT